MSVNTTNSTRADIAIIGGSGLYQMPGLSNKQTLNIDTPYGAPSAAIALGDLAGATIAFLSRHGSEHHLPPSAVPYRANIHALKQLGVKYIISVSAVGSLQEHIAPLDMVVPDQMIDLTKKRHNTFFDQGVVAHVAMAHPTCPALAAMLQHAYQQADIATGQCHKSGTYVCIEGPQFSTRAESLWYRQMGADIIGMTNAPEAKLAREASMAYATLALVTDYDCWQPDRVEVSADYAVSNLKKNADNAQKVVAKALALLKDNPPESEAHTALEKGLVTPVAQIDAATRARLSVLLPTA